MVACGDIARFPNLLFDDVPRRIEHWTMVTDTGQEGRPHPGLGAGRPAMPEAVFAPVPSFWSDQYGLRIQSFGAAGLADADVRVIEGDLGGEVAAGYYRDGQLVGVVLVGLGGRHLAYHQQIAALRP